MNSYSVIPNLRLLFKESHPLSPHVILDGKKNFHLMKPDATALFDLQCEIQDLSHLIFVRLQLEGLNYHTYELLGELYGDISRLIKRFEQIYRSCHQDIKQHYVDTPLPSHKDVFNLMKSDFVILHTKVEQNLIEAKQCHLTWPHWDENEIKWERVGARFNRK